MTKNRSSGTPLAPSQVFVPTLTPTGTAIPAPNTGPTLAPNPLTVKISMDAKFSASAVISETGGNIETKGQDGSHFTLDLPPGAVIEATKISVTPMTLVDGLPLSGGLVPGVILEPDGLQFSRPVTLTIETTRPMSSGDYQAIAFATRGDGREFYLYPSHTEGPRTTMLLAHFSSEGVGSGTQADIANQKREHVPTDPIDRLHQEAVGNQERAPLLRQLTNAYLYIESQIDRASTGAEFEAARLALADWITAVPPDLWDDLKDNLDLADSLFAVRVQQLVNRLARECASQNDLTQVGELLKWYRRINPGAGWSIAYWLGDAAKKEMQDNVNRCLSFELQFDSTIMWECSPFDWTFTARSIIPIRYGGGSELTGQAPMDLQMKLVFKGNMPAVLHVLDTATQGGTMRVTVQLPAYGAGSTDKNLSVDMKIAGAMGRAKFQACTGMGCGPETWGDDFVFDNLFSSLHQGEGDVLVANSTPDGAVIAHQVFDRSKSFGGCPAHEYTTLMLIHKAQ